MTEHPAVTALRDRAIAFQRKHKTDVSFCTDAHTFARGKNPGVLVAIARPDIAYVIAIDAAEFTWEEQLMFANLMGFPDAVKPSAMERLTTTK